MWVYPSTLNNWIPNGKNRYKNTIETSWDWVLIFSLKVEFICFDCNFFCIWQHVFVNFHLTWCACLHHPSVPLAAQKQWSSFFSKIYWNLSIILIAKAWLAGWLLWTGNKIVQWNTIHVDTIWFRWSNMSICFLLYMVPSVIQLLEYNPNSNLEKYFAAY